MKKVSRKWKVFVIVLCMLFTMTPGTVFADESGGINELISEEQIPPLETPPPGEAENPAQLEQILDNEDPPSGNDDTSKSNGQMNTENDSNATPPTVGDPNFNVAPMTFAIGTITITKEVRGNPATAATFNFEVEPKDGGEIKTATIVGSGSAIVRCLAYGEYYVRELKTDNYDPLESVKIVKITTMKPFKTADFLNTYCPPTPTTGDIKISKFIDGDPAPDDTEFTFTVTGPSGPKSVILSGGESETINGLLPGDYIVSEAPVQNFTPDGNDKTVTVEPGIESFISFTNTYHDPTTPPTAGSITIHKVVNGKPLTHAMFTFRISRQMEAFNSMGSNEPFDDKVVYITGPGMILIDNLPPGDYTVTEENIPKYYAVDDAIQEASVNEGENIDLPFTNTYDNPNDKPTAYVSKGVALYDGIQLPTSFEEDRLEVSGLNQKVIYKIQLNCNLAWEYAEKWAGLTDSYNGTVITNELLVADFEGALKKATEVNDEYGDFPDSIYLIAEADTIYYFVDTLTKSGIYTNTASIYESVESGAPINIIASSTVVVEVKDSSPPDGDDDDDDNNNPPHHHYYQVTYNPNYPAATDTSGSVPMDNNDYSYNNVVSVKANTGDLKVGNYIFDGWNTKADGSETAYQPGNTFNIKNDITLYAQWKTAEEDDDTVQDSDGNVDDDSNTMELSNEMQDNGLDDVPKTGSSAPLIPMLLLGLLSLAAIILGRKKNLE